MSVSSIAPNLQVYWFPVLQRIFEFVESHVWTKPRVGEEEWRWFPSYFEASAELRIVKLELKQFEGEWENTQAYTKLRSEKRHLKQKMQIEIEV